MTSDSARPVTEYHGHPECCCVPPPGGAPRTPEQLRADAECLLQQALALLATAARDGGRVRLGMSAVTGARALFTQAARGGGGARRRRGRRRY